MYRLMPDGHTAIGNFDSGEPLPGKDDPTLNSFDSDFIDGEVDDVLTGVRPSFAHTLTSQNHTTGSLYSDTGRNALMQSL